MLTSWLPLELYIAEGSVDQALRGKHYRCALHGPSFMYEALMHLQLIKNIAGLELAELLKSVLLLL